MGTEDPLYFFHIPKTSGMSTWVYLDHAFPGRKRCPWWLWDQLVQASREEIQQWDLFRGHFLTHLEGFVGRNLRTFTMLREPVERTISHYYHVRRAQDNPFHRESLCLSLREFCVDPRTSHLVRNYQSSWLAKAPLDPVQAGDGMTPEDFSRYCLQRTLGYPDLLTDGTLFDRAVERLSTFVTVGFAEEFDASMARFSRIFDAPAPSPLTPVNVADNRVPADSLDAETLGVIQECTRVDQRLYDFARAAWALTPGSVEAPLAVE